MIFVLSPSKTLDFEEPRFKEYSEPDFLGESQELVEILKKKKVKDLKALMSISDNLAVLNAQRYEAFEQPFTLDNAKQAVLAFKGDVYTGLNSDELNKEDLRFAQDHLRILSGLYGLLKPMDLIQPYRLEMGTKLQNKKGKDLYAFWDDKITDQINEELKDHKEKVLVNLASKEYFKSINTKKLDGRLLTISFKEYRNDKYKVIAFNAKKARGLMSRYIIQNRIDEVERLKSFDWDDYFYNPDLSDEKEWVFTR
jgi:cytoplasmic iron level regulating protein YaaA (DUF328/UPF0246 family)